MDGVTQQNASLVEEAAAAAEALQQQAASLAEAVSVFKIDARHMTAAPAIRRTPLKVAPARTRAPAAKLAAAKPATAAAPSGDGDWETF